MSDHIDDKKIERASDENKEKRNEKECLNTHVSFACKYSYASSNAPLGANTFRTDRPCTHTAGPRRGVLHTRMLFRCPPPPRSWRLSPVSAHDACASSLAGSVSASAARRPRPTLITTMWLGTAGTGTGAVDVDSAGVGVGAAGDVDTDSCLCIDITVSSY